MKYIRFFILGFAFFILGLSVFIDSIYAKNKYTERYYQEIWCNKMGGELEVVLSDRSRCDCLLPNFAVEVDFAKKWAEAIGQSLLYAALTNRQPGILLIAKDEKEFEKYSRRIRIVDTLLDHCMSIPIWVIYRDINDPKVGNLGDVNK